MRHGNVRAFLSSLFAVVLAGQVLLVGVAAHAATPAGEDSYDSIAEVPEDAYVAALDEGEDYEAGEVIVAFEDGVGDVEAQRVVDDALTVGGEAEVSDSGTGEGVALVEVEDGASVAQAVTELSEDPDVAYAQPNYIYTVADEGEDADDSTGLMVSSTTVNDTSVSKQWYLGDVSAYDAWGVAGGSDTSVSVAVIDTGCDASHSDLATNILATHSVVSGGTNGSSDVTDSNGHGTSVCGVISAVADNGVGIAGVSHNAKLVPIKASTNDSQGAFSSQSITAALSWAVSNSGTYDIRVINMSVAGVAGTYHDRAMESAISSAYGAGILVVCAAGNKNSGGAPYASVPGDYDTCLSVMNLTSSHALSDTSNYNVPGTRTKDLCAPGTDIYTTTIASVSSSGYTTMSGTSFAAPIVSGAAALAYAVDPSLDAAGCMSILEGTATDLGTSGWDETYGYGEVNAYAAVTSAKAAATTSESQETEVDSSTGNASNTGSSAGNNSSAASNATSSTNSNNSTMNSTSNSTSGSSSTDSTTDEGSPVVDVLRLYNPWTGEHLYTTDASEYASLPAAGWRQEGLAWRASSRSGTEVLRLYNPYSGDHLYTTSTAEYAALAAAGWRQEGASFYAPASGTEVLRLYNPYEQVGTHLYTTDPAEYASLAGLGWSQEGVAWHGIAG